VTEEPTQVTGVLAHDDDGWEVGDVISEQFLIEEILGRTPAGRSFRVKTIKSEREMALKTLTIQGPDRDIYAALRDPLKTASQLKHKNLVQIFGLGRDGDTVFVVMEFVDGRSLTRHIARRRDLGETFSPKSVFNIVANICNGLAAIHTQTAHGALTPGHVHVTDAGRVKVGNLVYGHAAATGLFPQGEGVFADSPFMAPEFRNEPGLPTAGGDIYSAGMITAELLSSEPLDGLGFAARTAALAVADEYSGRLRALIAHATEKDPNDRLQDPIEFRDRLRSICMEDIDPRAAEAAQGTGGGLLHRVEVAPPSNDDIIVEVPTASDQSIDPFAHAARILGTGPVPIVHRPGTEAKKGEGAKQFLVSKDNLDYGPYTFDEVLAQLRRDEIDEITVVLDRNTQMRTPLAEHRVFAAAVLEYIPIRQARRRHEAEQRQHRVETAKTAGRWTAIIGVVAALLVGAALGGWYFFIRPQPAALPQGELFADLSVQYQMAPPPTEFANVALDDDLLAGLFSTQAPARKIRRGKSARATKHGNGRSGHRADSDENVSEVDLDVEGGTDRILTDRDVNLTIRRGFGGVRACMLKELKRNPGFKGVSVQFFVRPTGTTGGVRVSGAASPAMNSCLKGRFRSLRFPQHGGLNRSVSLPLYIK
jgi:hypothetical protein